MEAENKFRRVDFHVHYGDESARKIIERAREKNVSVLGFVKRAEVSDRIEEFISYGKDLGVEVIPGVEYLARLDDRGTNVELIILGFDYKHPPTRKYFGIAEGIEKNRELAKKQKNFLEDKGFSFEELDSKYANTLQDLLNGKISEKAIRFCELVVRNHLNMGTVEQVKVDDSVTWGEVNLKYGNRQGYIDNREALVAKFLWCKYFAQGKGGFIPVQEDAEKIIDVVHEAKGVVIYSPEDRFNNGAWESLLEFGIDGIMGWHGKKLDLERAFLRDIRRRGLLILGGSDFEPLKDDWQIGTGDNNALFVSFRRYQDYLRYLKEKFGG